MSWRPTPWSPTPVGTGRPHPGACMDSMREATASIPCRSVLSALCRPVRASSGDRGSSNTYLQDRPDPQPRSGAIDAGEQCGEVSDVGEQPHDIDVVVAFEVGAGRRRNRRRVHRVHFRWTRNNRVDTDLGTLRTLTQPRTSIGRSRCKALVTIAPCASRRERGRSP